MNRPGALYSYVHRCGAVTVTRSGLPLLAMDLCVRDRDMASLICSMAQRARWQRSATSRVLGAPASGVASSGITSLSAFAIGAIRLAMSRITDTEVHGEQREPAARDGDGTAGGARRNTALRAVHRWPPRCLVNRP